jgi:hypothetical protein
VEYNPFVAVDALKSRTVAKDVFAPEQVSRLVQVARGTEMRYIDQAARHPKTVEVAELEFVSYTMRTKKIPILLSMFIIVLTVGAFAQQGPRGQAVTTAPVDVLASPPRQGYLFIQPPGSVVGHLGEGEHVEILDSQTVNTFAGRSVWVNVKSQTSGVTGWAPYANFKE